MIRVTFVDVHPGCLMKTGLWGARIEQENQGEVIAEVQGEKTVA